MNENDKPKIEDLAAEQNLWNAYREVHRLRGLDLDKSLAEWAREQRQKLRSPGAREEFAELSKYGCEPQGLAVIVAAVRNAPLLQRFWTQMVGHSGNRDKATRKLEDAAQALEGLFAEVIANESGEGNAELAKIGRLPISSVITELRIYVRLINFAESISADTETRSPAELAKYLLTSYVKRMTGRFHDRNVSGLIEEIVGPPDYNEVAHRMWRARNYMRIEKHYSWITRFLVAMTVVISTKK